MSAALNKLLADGASAETRFAAKVKDSPPLVAGVTFARALFGEAVGALAVTVTTKGLPSTSTDPASGTSTVAVLAAAFAVLFGSWIILRRVSAARG